MWKYFSIYQIITVVALLIIFARVLSNGRVTKLFILILFVAVVEVFAINYLGIRYGNNLLANNLYSLFLIPFYFIFFYKKKKDLFFLLVWMVFVMLYLFIYDIKSMVFATPYLVGLSGVVFFIFRSFYFKILNDNYLNIWIDFKTYLGAGIVLFLVCSFPLLANINSLILNNESFKAFYILLTIGNVILNLGYLMAAIIEWKSPKYSELS